MTEKEMKMKMKIGDRVIVSGVQLLSNVDEPATVVSVYTNTLKVLVDSTGTKWYVGKHHCAALKSE